MSEGETLTKVTVYLDGTAKAQYFGGQAKSKKTVTKSAKKPIDFSTVIFGLGILLLGLVLWYAFNINRIATLGYEIKDTEKNIQELKNENDELKIKSSELKSIGILETKAGDIGMINPEEVDYLNVVEGLALKE